jgi:GntR family transcriptional regulator
MQHIPKYYKISQEIISTIQNGELQPGMKVPSENEIISKYKVSNTTARKILHEIEAAGWAIKIKSKGTFVRTKNVERTVTRILGFTKNMIEAGFTPATKLLGAKLFKDGYGAFINGRKYSLHGPVYQIYRLRFADDIPMMLEKRYISLQMCPDIATRSFEGSLYDIYENEYGLKLTEVNQMLRTINITDAPTMRLFEVEKSIPAFLVDGVTFCGREMILEMEESIYRGDKYHFAVRASSK